ncbi:hypothetical protein GBA52_003438 [Prunus armeniaca]|nr:hypothetical protein GBA52_003438 [Prunus armeniaca]
MKAVKWLKKKSFGGYERVPLIKEEWCKFVELEFTKHCEGCIRDVKKCCKQTKGVESVVVDKDNPVVVVEGRFLLEKLCSRLRNVTNKVVTVKRSEMEETQEQGESSHGDDHRQDKQENNNQNAETNQQDEKNSQSSKEIVLRVLMHCEGCKSKVSKCLKGVDGIEDVTVDYANQRVVVKGKKANPLKVLERLQKKYSSNAELISPKPKPENKEKKEPQKKEEAQPQVKVVVLKMLMHCEGCANDIKKYLEKMKGVLSVEANMESSRVTVRGVVDPPKLIEYIKNQLGKHAEIVKQEQGQKQGNNNNNNNKKDPERENIFQYPPQYSSQHIYPNQTFSDENPFACSIM